MTPLAGLEALWAQTRGEPSICIAILDGPVDITHPCFGGAQLTQVETLVASRAVPTGVASVHGTHIASVLFGQPDSPLLGVAPQCCGVLLPVFADSADSDSISCSQLDLARAITQAVQQGAHIINISGGQITPSGKAHPLLADAVQLCADSNVLIVAAAGNDGCACLHVPAALPSVLVVGAMDEQGLPFDFSNWGENYQMRGLLAPGANIVGATPGGGVVAKSGTSFATPLVAGVAALFLSLQKKRGQKPDPTAIREALLASAIPCGPQALMDCRRFLRGSLNVPGAYMLLANPEKIPIVSPADPAKTEQAQPALAPRVVESGNLEPASPTADRTFMEGCPITQRRKSMSDVPQGPQYPAIEAQNNEQETQETRPMLTPLLSLTPSMPAPPPANRPDGSLIQPSQVRPSQAAPGALVYALGVLGYDFGTDARRDWFANALVDSNGVRHPPEDVQTLLDFLDSGLRQPPDPRAFAAEYLIWTLNLDATPIYAIRPQGAFAADTYQRLRDFYKAQLAPQGGVDFTRVTVPGILNGNVTLRSGQVVPVIAPDLRGLGQTTPTQIDQDATIGQQLLYRLFYELRNLGLAPQDRAKNAMAVYNIAAIGSNPVFKGYVLEGVTVEKSPVCRPGSDCWDVVITAFDPTNRLEHARRIYRQTVDISDVIPVPLGGVHEWFAY